MDEIKLIYFMGCPNYEEAKRSLKEAGVERYTKVCQDDSPGGHPMENYSSSAILKGEEITFGAKSFGLKACSVGFPDVEMPRRLLKK